MIEKKYRKMIDFLSILAPFLIKNAQKSIKTIKKRRLKIDQKTDSVFPLFYRFLEHFGSPLGVHFSPKSSKNLKISEISRFRDFQGFKDFRDV